ncbi:Zinc finger, C2H2, LYAR-type [Kalmanozyma brasiliensis GHG001]|uniref:18S rRNA factor 2 n=1 Tax=Kalmanozyma brasiliensis (strain GHG001) TaxID=1365824 RepID=V5GRW3_KALBG|nr:Zinc finger, C2H2, LYAR-type [Kalmanozyma brasiliensis GHG001]EST08657.1 Zinc finger, C2H2, LYAR-type [Kalmanozyma brasiliensis GHG001]
MVSFNCDGCGDVVKKPKLIQHYNRCYAPVTCLDCSKQFNSPNEFKAHNSCVSEAEKYERTVYRGPKHADSQNGTSQKGKSPTKVQKVEEVKTPSKAEEKRDEDVAVEAANEGESSSKSEKKEKKEKKDKKEKKEKKEKKSTAPAPVEVADDASGSDIDPAEHDQDDPMQAASEEARIIKPLSTSELEAFQKKQRKLGIVYISRIPPGMTPAKVRHILSNFGELGRIYLHQDSTKPGESKKRSSVAHYSEGWVEFTSKKVAKAAAEMLNAQPIGGLAASNSKKSGSGGGSSKMGKSSKRFADDVWTMKYLKGFKWHMLSEQMAQERASHAARLRTELSQSAYEQKDYLKKVERARVQKDKLERRKRKAEAVGGEVDDKSGMEKSRTFKQRKVVQKDVRDQA